MKRALWVLAVVLLVLAVAWDFATATTFLGDDYLFRAFGRLEANPLLAFVADKHGGEYYRPLPMLIWWLLERISGGQVWVFALAAFVQHALCAVLLAVVGRKIGFAARTAVLAGCLFFAAPAEREAALWFSASTDLLAGMAMLGTTICFLSNRPWLRAFSLALGAVAFFCKESALVLPALLASACWFRAARQGRPRARRVQKWTRLEGLLGEGRCPPLVREVNSRTSPHLRPSLWLGYRRTVQFLDSSSVARCLTAVLPHVVVAALFIVARTLVLRGVGGTNDPLAPWWGRAVQLAAGLLHAVTCYAPLPEWVALLAGACLLAWAGAVTFRQRDLAGFAFIWVVIALAPLPAAGWVVGARYFYVPAAGLMLLLALALENTSGLASVFAVAAFLGLGLVSGQHRATEVTLYRQAVAAASAGIGEGVSRGQRVFFVSGGVKDLDLAIKLDRRASAAVRSAVVIPDVPASFVWVPPDLAGRLDFLLARPSLPPSGAYRFGDARLVGLARREDAPDLNEVLTRLPELRILRLGYKGGEFTVEDRTEQYARGRE